MSQVQEYRDALLRERDGYERYGRTARVAEVDAELARIKKATAAATRETVVDPAAPDTVVEPAAPETAVEPAAPETAVSSPEAPAPASRPAPAKRAPAKKGAAKKAPAKKTAPATS